MTHLHPSSASQLRILGSTIHFLSHLSREDLNRE